MSTSVSNAGTRAGANMMNRFDLTKRLLGKLQNEEAVVGGIGNTHFDLWAAGRRPQNFYMLGSMGLACPIALGVALAQPDRQVIALEGDGSLLMQLGCLTTIANLAPSNLTVIVMDNGIYQITGGQPTATSGKADLVAIAKGAGIERADWARDEVAFEAFVETALATNGPSLIAAHIDGKSPQGTTEREPTNIRARFMAGLGVRSLLEK